MRFFQSLARSWQFAKISYGIIWDFKQLVIFPILSTIALVLVLVSFIAPLLGFGVMQSWTAGNGAPLPPSFYIITFAFYFICYFVIVFFNTALIACAMQVIEGKAPTLGDGLSVAFQRLPQIVAWALVSAVVGVLLKVVENAHEKAGQFVSAILGSAWSALTYLVVPVIAAEGVGPVDAVRRSFETIKSTWGEALAGNMGIGMLGFLLSLPLILLTGAAAALVAPISPIAAGVVVCLGVVLLMTVAAVNSAADAVFRAILYNFATGNTLPESIPTEPLRQAFTSRN